MKKKRIKKVARHSFSGKMSHQINLLFITMIICCVAIPFGVLCINSEREMKSYAMTASEDILTSVGEILNSNFEAVSTFSKNIMFSNEVRRYLTALEENARLYSFSAIQKMYSASIQYVNVNSIYVFRTDGNYINITPDGRGALIDESVLTKSDWLQELMVKNGAYSVQINGNGLFHLSTDEKLITFIRVIKDLESQKEIGIIAINFTSAYLRNILKEFLSSSTEMAVVTTEGDFLCGDKDTGKYYSVFENQDNAEKFSVTLEFHHLSDSKNIVSGYRPEKFPLILLRHEKMSFFKYITGTNLTLFVFLLILTATCFFVIHRFLTIRFTRPVEKLVESMKKVETGWLHRVSVECSIEEIQNLKDSYNQMLVQVNNLIEQLVEKEKAAQQAKLEVILEQMNPHFLYNTLETIGYMAFESPRGEIYDAIECLGDFYRSFLNNGNDKVSLKTELETVQKYLKMQKYRYGEILEDKYDIEKECEEYLVPKLIFQPLIENSIYHGIRPKGEKGEIMISAHRAEDRLCLIVYDSGVGMSYDEQKKALYSNNTGFGLKKTLERIQILYGDKDCYRIESQEGIYCKIIMYLPLEKSEDNNV